MHGFGMRQERIMQTPAGRLLLKTLKAGAEPYIDLGHICTFRTIAMSNKISVAIKRNYRNWEDIEGLSMGVTAERLSDLK